MANFEGLALPAYGSFTRYNASQTSTWEVADDGHLAITLKSTGATIKGVSIADSTAIIDATTFTNLYLTRASTKAGATTDAFIYMGQGAAAAVDAYIEINQGAAATANYMIEVSSTTRPAYFLNLAASASATLTEAVAGCLYSKTVIQTLSAYSTAVAFAALKCLVGSKAYYIRMLPDSAVSA